MPGPDGASQLADVSLHHHVAFKVANLAAVERLTLLHTCENRGRAEGRSQSRGGTLEAVFQPTTGSVAVFLPISESVSALHIDTRCSVLPITHDNNR